MASGLQGLAIYDFEDFEFRQFHPFHPRSALRSLRPQSARFVLKELISGNISIFLSKSWREILKCLPRWLFFRLTNTCSPRLNGSRIRRRSTRIQRGWSSTQTTRWQFWELWKKTSENTGKIITFNPFNFRTFDKNIEGTLELLMFSRQLIDLTALMLQVQGRDRPWGTQGVQGSTLPERRRLAVGPDLGLCSGGSSHHWCLCPVHNLRQEKGEAQRELPSQRHRRRYVIKTIFETAGNKCN